MCWVRYRRERELDATWCKLLWSSRGGSAEANCNMCHDQEAILDSCLTQDKIDSFSSHHPSNLYTLSDLEMIDKIVPKTPHSLEFTFGRTLARASAS